MKIKYILLFSMILMILESCGSIKKELIQSGDTNDAIHNAILDFINTSKLYKKDTVFDVQFKELNNDILIISIARNNMKMLLTEEINVGVKKKFHTRFFEMNNKLFFWWDNDYPLTQETLDVYEKYGLLQDDEDGWVVFPDTMIDDSQKGVDYYFCKNNISKYKKVTTNIGLGSYDAPSIDCND